MIKLSNKTHLGLSTRESLLNLMIDKIIANFSVEMDLKKIFKPDQVL